jgi:hypothetical protein
MTIPSATIATFEDKRADLMDTIHYLKLAQETADAEDLGTIGSIISNVEDKLFAVNDALLGMKSRETRWGI